MRRKDREVTDLHEIKEIIDMSKTVCIAMIDQDVPYVLPMSYGYELVNNELILYLHCAKQGRKIDILNTNNNVCFTIFNQGTPIHAETPCNSGYYFSSVIGNGKVEWINENAEKKKALKIMFEHQSGQEVEFNEQQANSVCVFKIVSDDFSAKKKPMK